MSTRGMSRFSTGGSTEEGFFHYRGGMDAAIARGLAYAPYADLIWCETSEPDIEQARRFAEAIHAHYPGKLLAYNCSPSFHWKKLLTDAEIAAFQSRLARLGYKFQFVTLAGFHSLNGAMFELSRDYARTGMTAYARLQEREFALAASDGYSGDPPPAVRRDRLLRRGADDHHGRPRSHYGPGRFDRARSSDKPCRRRLAALSLQGKAVRNNSVNHRVERQADVRAAHGEILSRIFGDAVAPVDEAVHPRIDGRFRDGFWKIAAQAAEERAGALSGVTVGQDRVALCQQDPLSNRFNGLFHPGVQHRAAEGGAECDHRSHLGWLFGGHRPGEQAAQTVAEEVNPPPVSRRARSIVWFKRLRIKRLGHSAFSPIPE